MGTQSVNALDKAPGARFIFVDLRDSGGWEDVERLLVDFPVDDILCEQASPQIGARTN